MIDVENLVFDHVYASVSGLVPEGNFASNYAPAPASFPFVTLMEMDNAVDTRHMSSADDEEYAIVTYEANVYAMDKQECRNILDTLDRAMYRLNFTRLSTGFIPNLADRTIYRATARYQAVADTNSIMYRR